MCLLQRGPLQPRGVAVCLSVRRDGASSARALRRGSDVGRDGWSRSEHGEQNCGGPLMPRKLKGKLQSYSQ